MYTAEKQNYRFEDIEVDLARGCLVCDGEERHLRQQALQVLVYLLERRERLVSKAELFENVWNNSAVTFFTKGCLYVISDTFIFIFAYLSFC